MFCKNCGQKNDEPAKFCQHCGSALTSVHSEEGKQDNDKTVKMDDSIPKTVGNIKKVIDAIIIRKGKGDPLLVINIRKKLVLKGINPSRYTYETIDDPVVLAKLRDLAKDFGFMV